MEVEQRLLKFRKNALKKQENRDLNAPNVKISNKQKYQSFEKYHNIIEDSLKRKDINFQSDSKYSWNQTDIVKIFLKIILYFICLIIFIKLEFGLVYFIVSSILIIYFNTSNQKNKSGLSAYSVFNPNIERIQGTVTSEQLQKNMLGQFS